MNVLLFEEVGKDRESRIRSARKMLKEIEVIGPRKTRQIGGSQRFKCKLCYKIMNV